MAAVLPEDVAEQVPDTHFWSVEDAEVVKLEQLLGVEWSSLGVRGFRFDGPKPLCSTCGKIGGFDDIIYTALEKGDHSKTFIIEALKAGMESQPHDSVLCSSCGIQWKEPAAKWATKSPWIIRNSWPEDEIDADGTESSHKA
ncbi:hypothetical protein V8C40DRAFT_252166 [Trichoderma camerunense]